MAGLPDPFRYLASLAMRCQPSTLRHRSVAPSAFAAVLAILFAAGVGVAQDKSPGRESVTIEPYTGPPVYLPESEPPPPPRRVESRVVKENFPNTDTPRFERGVVKFSDDSVVSDGPHKEYYSSGQLHVEGVFKLGRASGSWTYYHPNGKVAKQVTYRDGRPDGDVNVYNEDGQLIKKRSYVDGQRSGTWEKYTADGTQKLLEQSYVDGMLEGVVKAWYSNGQLRQESTFVAGKREGLATEWTLAGDKRAELNFKAGKRDGEATVWQRDGRVLEQTYEEGRLVKRSERRSS